MIQCIAPEFGLGGYRWMWLDHVGPLPGRQGWDTQRVESARPGREPPGLDPSLGRFNGKQVKTNPYETIVFAIYTIASAIDRGGF